VKPDFNSEVIPAELFAAVLENNSGISRMRDLLADVDT
jgi:hypothetical protein